MSIRAPRLNDLAALRAWFDRVVWAPAEPELPSHTYRLRRPDTPGLCLDDWAFRYELFERDDRTRRRLRPTFVAISVVMLALLLMVFRV